MTRSRSKVVDGFIDVALLSVEDERHAVEREFQGCEYATVVAIHLLNGSANITVGVRIDIPVYIVAGQVDHTTEVSIVSTLCVGECLAIAFQRSGTRRMIVLLSS